MEQTTRKLHLKFASRARRDERIVRSKLRRAMRLENAYAIETFVDSVDFWRRRRAADLRAAT